MAVSRPTSGSDQVIGPRFSFLSLEQDVRYFYLCMAALGAVIPWYFNLQAINDAENPFTAAGFVAVGFQGSAMLGSLAADFWIGCIVSLVWMVAEARRLKMPRIWAYIIVTFLVAWACALPLFLFFRERHLESVESAPA